MKRDAASERIANDNSWLHRRGDERSGLLKVGAHGAGATMTWEVDGEDRVRAAELLAKCSPTRSGLREPMEKRDGCPVVGGTRSQEGEFVL